MKRRQWRVAQNWRARNGFPADVGHSVTGRAAFCHRAAQRGMAGETIVRNSGMGGYHRAGGQHRGRKGKGKCHDTGKAGGDDRQDQAFHDHPQKMTELMICAMARTAKASAIG